MKIFYAVQATGNGHISRAYQLYPYLKKYGEVDFFLSGNNASLEFNLPVKYLSKGCSLHYSKCGGLNYWDIIRNVNPAQIYKDAHSLPLKKYDIIINDFDSITSLACKLQKVRSVQFGHQASFISDAVPRPEKRSFMGESVLKYYASAPKNMGLHFERYDNFIYPPIIKEEILQSDPKNKGHITVYLPSFQKDCLQTAFSKLQDITFHWFLQDVVFPYREGNILYLPINQEKFNESLVNCQGIITGGGFETPAEALFLKKKIMSIPIKNHYEQECNAAALKKLGICVLYDVTDDFDVRILKWLNDPTSNPVIEPNNISETLEILMDTYHEN